MTRTPATEAMVFTYEPSPGDGDALDGAALRRLREALPRRVRIDVTFAVMEYGERVLITTTGTNYEYVALAPTIAEACDAAREALG